RPDATGSARVLTVRRGGARAGPDGLAAARVSGGSAVTTHSTTHSGAPCVNWARRTRAALASRRGGGPPGHHPGHPTACGGLPSSEPGLDAGTHDLPATIAGGSLSSQAGQA